MKIAILEPLGIKKDLLLKKLEPISALGHEIICFDDRREDAATLIKRSENAHVVVLSNIKFGADVLRELPSLKMICVAFTGVDHIDMHYCRAHGIAVCNCAGYSTSAVADLVFGMAIALARNIIPCDTACKASKTKDGLVGFELEGKNFGIIGMGAIGQRVASIAKAFGCHVYAFSKTVKVIDGVTFVSKEELLKACDILSIHIPQNDQTVDFIGESELKLMKPTAFLINTARGPVVNALALAAALKAGELAGAGVDVFEAEPPIQSDNPLFGAPNTILTPHVGFASAQAFEKRADIVSANISAWLSGTPQNLIK